MDGPSWLEVGPVSAARGSLTRAALAAFCLILMAAGSVFAQASAAGFKVIRFDSSDGRSEPDSTTAAESSVLALVPDLLLADESHISAPVPAQGVDAWGVKRNWGLAIGEVVAVNNVVWLFNEYIRGAAFTQVNPRSWYDNIKTGFVWDDNHFTTNMFAHPYHGSMYYSAARSNGFNYWQSAPFAIAGSFMWECCGETHPMSSNDWIATSIGGIAIGETFYRLSGTVLDNTATGSERTWREIGALLISPLRGFNRLVSGRWSEVGPNPDERMPSSMSNQLSAGVRVVGEGKSIDDSTQTNAFFEVDYAFGSPFSSENRKPFDFFLMSLQVNFSEKQTLGRLQIQGNLWTKDLKVSDKVHHAFTLTQDYDYMNNFAYEFGGQSFAGSLNTRWLFSENWHLRTDLSLYWMLMGAVNSDFAFIAEFPPEFDQERLREYDFGTGGGPALGAALTLKGRDVLALRYRLTYLKTLNGSINEGDDAHHYVHWLFVRGRVPISRGFGVGADAGVFLRDSYYTCDVCDDYVQQRNPQIRLYGVWQVGREGF